MLSVSCNIILSVTRKAPPSAALPAAARAYEVVTHAEDDGHLGTLPLCPIDPESGSEPSNLETPYETSTLCI